MLDTHYTHPKLTLLYDLDSPWSEDRQFYLDLAAKPSQNILDLGCGTGLLCNAYAEKGHHVTGVDPSNAMLDIGRKKYGDAHINWVQSTAQSFQSRELFDLIIMTGHALQVLLSDENILATFKTIQTHLDENGIAVFESRNPLIDWKRQWDYEMIFSLEGEPVKETRKLVSFDQSIMIFDLIYDFPGETLTSNSTLRFASKKQIETLLRTAGLEIINLYGDWKKNAFDDNTSEEMIFVIRKNS